MEQRKRKRKRGKYVFLTQEANNFTDLLFFKRLRIWPFFRWNVRSNRSLCTDACCYLWQKFIRSICSSHIQSHHLRRIKLNERIRHSKALLRKLNNRYLRVKPNPEFHRQGNMFSRCEVRCISRSPLWVLYQTNHDELGSKNKPKTYSLN